MNHCFCRPLCRLGLVLLMWLSLSEEAALAEKEDKRPLILWHAYRAEERSALEYTARQWNEKGRKNFPPLKLLAVPFDAFTDKISAAIPRGHGPDLFIAAHDRVGDWAESKIIEPIEFWMTEKHADQFLFKSLSPLCHQDSLYGLPMAFKSTALFYNKDLVPHPPQTTDELLALGRKLTDGKTGRYGLIYDNIRLYFHAPWLFGYGGELFNTEGELKINTPHAVKALKFTQKLGGPQGIIPPEASPSLTTSLFNQGKAAMAISGPWMLGELALDKINVGVAPLPLVSATGKPASPFLGTESLMMSATCKRKAMAFQAMKFLTSNAMAVERAIRARQPVANHAAWTDRRVTKDPILMAFRQQQDTARVIPGTAEMRLVWAPYDIALQKAMTGQSSAFDALEEAEAEIRRYLHALRASAKGEK
jgi:arabinogalactan oligomer/maltooligosaccharide transport system substrate-binding protein